MKVNEMNMVHLATAEILNGYDAVAELYPHVPPLSLWRAWEYAAYRKFKLNGRVLDVGCGDGRYFQLIWPHITRAVGVDMDPAVVALAKQSGIYEAVHQTVANAIPEPSASCDHAFANCSLEHMDHLDAVLSEVSRCIKPSGTLICSVVTNRFVEWAMLSKLVRLAGYDAAADSLQKAYEDYHHLANPLTVQGWQDAFGRAGFAVDTHIPIIPSYNGAIFLLIDALWHVRRADGGEIGENFYQAVSGNASFPKGFKKIFDGLLTMETDWSDCIGAVFQCRKRA
jgi:SAM-dependent methyltransferase